MTQNLQNDEASQAAIDQAHPFGGMGDPEDVAKAAVRSVRKPLFLATDCSRCSWRVMMRAGLLACLYRSMEGT